MFHPKYQAEIIHVFALTCGKRKKSKKKKIVWASQGLAIRTFYGPKANLASAPCTLYGVVIRGAMSPGFTTP